MFPFLVWAAFRFQLAGATPCVLIASLVTVTAATQGSGPFARMSLLTVLAILQIVNGSVALTALLTSAAVKQRNRREMEQTFKMLSEVVNHLEQTTRLRPLDLPTLRRAIDKDHQRAYTFEPR